MRRKINVLQVVHTLKYAGTEKLVYDMISEFPEEIQSFVCCLDTLGDLGKELLKENIPVFCANRNPGYDISSAKKIAQFTRENSIDIIHAHQYTPFFYSVISRLFNCRPKLVFTEHGRHYPDIDKFQRKLFNRMMAPFITRVTAVSEYAKECLIHLEWIQSKKIDVIYNGVDIMRFDNLKKSAAIRSELGIKDNDLVIGYVGRLHWVKNPEMLIKAFSIVQKKINNARLVFVGEGDQLKESKKTVCDLGLEKYVFFTGRRNDVLDILQIFDIFTLTSLTESTSVALIEAMLSGVPAIVTSVGGNPEILIDHETGLLCPDMDYKTFADLLMVLLNDKNARLSMGRKAQKIALERFSMAKMIEKYKKLYFDIVKRI